MSNIFNYLDSKNKDILFEDIKPVTITAKTKENARNSSISGNVRISNAMYRTDAEKEEYIKKSLERELP